MNPYALPSLFSSILLCGLGIILLLLNRWFVRHELKNRVEVIKEYNPELSQVEVNELNFIERQCLE